MAGCAPLPPWEQHAFSNALPRFTYGTLPSNASLKGFLITCTLDREKSATKEVMSLLTEHYITSNVRRTCDTLGNGDHQTNDPPTPGDRAPSSNSDFHRKWEMNADTGLNSLKRRHDEVEKSLLDNHSGILVLKMAQKGIVSVFFKNNMLDDPADLLSKILQDVGTGEKGPMRWCQRLIPIQATCLLSKESLNSLAFDLVKKHMQGCIPTKDQPITYAICFNRRGVGAKEDKGANLCKESQMLGRMDCIHVITDAVARAVPHAVVDLRTPQMVVLVEIIPFVGTQDSPVCGVSVVSGCIVNTKPKLCVKSLLAVPHPSKKPKT